MKLAAAFLIPLLALSPVSWAQTRGASIQSLSEEAKIGEQIHQQITSSFKPYTEPGVLDYLNDMTGRLASHAERQELNYRTVVLYDDKIYATSAPGGYIYLTTGLVYFLDNEAEMAAVLAHEIGELQEKDPRLSKSKKVLNTLLQAGTAVGPAFGQIGALAALGLAMAKNASDARVQAPDPSGRLLEADRKALHYMTEGGYDPQGLIDVQYKFLNAKEQMLPFFYDYYQSRPITEERIKNMNQTFSELPLANRKFETRRETFLEKTKGIREIFQTA